MKASGNKLLEAFFVIYATDLYTITTLWSLLFVCVVDMKGQGSTIWVGAP